MDLSGVLSSVVQSVLKTLGQDLTLYRVDPSTYDPVSGVDIPKKTTYTVKGSPPTAYAQYLVDGNVIQAGDMEILVSAKSVRDAMGSVPLDTKVRVVFGSEDFGIERATPVYAGTLPVMFKLQCRK